MDIKTKELTLSVIPAKEENFEFCLKLFEDNMKTIIENNWGYKDHIFKQNFRINEIRILKLKNENIGFFQFQHKKDLTYIKEIQIEKEFQNKEIELEVLKFIEDIAKENDKPKLQLQVFKDHYILQAYNNFGFKETKDLDKTLILEKN